MPDAARFMEMPRGLGAIFMPIASMSICADAGEAKAMASSNTARARVREKPVEVIE